MTRRALALGAVALAFASLATGCGVSASLREDSRAHLAAGAGVAAAGFVVGDALSPHAEERLLLGVGAGVGAAAAKELADAAGLGVAAWDDLAWSALGAALGALLAWAADELAAGDP